MRRSLSFKGFSVHPSGLRGLAAAALAITLAGCGADVAVTNPFEELLGQRAEEVVAARINGRPITVADVQAEAIRNGELQPGEVLAPDSPLFELTLEAMIDRRLLSIEAEAQGVARDPDVMRLIEAEREGILGSELMRRLQVSEIDEAAVLRFYQQQIAVLGTQGDEVQWRRIVAPDQETAQAARLRIERGEDFAVVALEVSTDQETRTNGGQQEPSLPNTMPPVIGRVLRESPIGTLVGPLRDDFGAWVLVRVDARGPAAQKSLEEMRPAILDALAFNLIQNSIQRVRNTARIEILMGPDAGTKGGQTRPPPIAAPAPPPEPAPPRNDTPEPQGAVRAPITDAPAPAAAVDQPPS